MGGGRSSGGGGRDLTRQELELIEAQTDAFKQAQRTQSRVTNEAERVARFARIGVQDSRRLATEGAHDINSLASLASDEGFLRNVLERDALGRASLDVGNISRSAPQFGLSSNLLEAINASRANARLPAIDPTLLDNLATGLRGRASDVRTSLGGSVDNFRNLLGQSLARSQDAPLANQMSLLNNLGARPGSVEGALTAPSLATFSDVLRGQRPEAFEGLFKTDTAARSALENQFQAARSRLIESGVRGGALERSLAGLEGQRALGVAGQVQDIENQERAATLGLLNQGLAAGISEPARRDALRLSALQGSGQLGLGQGQLQQGFFGLGGQTAQGFAAAQQAREALVNQTLGLSGDIGQMALQGRLAGREQLTSALGLQGQLAGTEGSLGFNIANAQQNAALQELGMRLQLADQLGAGADELAFGISPSLLTQAFQLRQAGLQATGLPLSFMQGGQGAPIDLSGALAAAASAAGGGASGPSQLMTASMGGIAGAGSGALTGAAIGAAGGPIGAGAGALIGGIVGIAGGLM